MLLYAITNRRIFAGNEPDRCAALLRQAEAWARAGVDFIQLREKDLSAEALLYLAKALVAAVRRAAMERELPGATRVLVNGPLDVALRSGADGLHLPSNRSGSLQQEIALAREACRGSLAVSVACHSPAQASAARAAGASALLFAPVFEKPLPNREPLPGVGLTALAAACQAAAPVPVFALGGVTRENARACVQAGAAGVAAIRLFAGADWLSLR